MDLLWRDASSCLDNWRRHRSHVFASVNFLENPASLPGIFGNPNFFRPLETVADYRTALERLRQVPG